MLENFQIDWIYKILFASLAGAIIGFERHHQTKEAGIRTHTFVAMGSALLVIISKYGFLDTNDFDSSRVAAAIISSIAFLGTGVIFVRKDAIHGLTTAAGIWTTSAIGMCIGAGMYLLSMIVIVLMIIVQFIFRTSGFRHMPRTSASLEVKVKQGTSIKDIVEAYRSLGYLCMENRIIKDSANDDSWIILSEVVSQKDIEPGHLLKEMQKKDFIESIEIH